MTREDGKDQGRQGEPSVGQPHDQLVHPAAEIAGEDAQGGADAASDHGPHHADDQRHPGAEDQPAEDIAGLKIGSEQRTRAAALHPERRLEDLRPRDRLGGVVGGDQIGE
jgi:hypothetical protein